MRVRSVVLAGIGIGALLAAWILSSPPMSAPDEGAHLIRAVSAAEGQWAGTPVRSNGVQTIAVANSRVFKIPANLAVVDTSPCFASTPGSPASCEPDYRLAAETEKSHVGTYYPLFYAPLGAAALISGSVPNAIYADRVVSALLCGLLLLIGFAVSCMSVWLRAAWFLAAGPLTFYVSSSAATNGIEVAASICFVCVSLEIARRGPARWLWLVWAVSGFALASAKSLGPLFLLFDLVAVIVITRSWRWWWDSLKSVPLIVGLVAVARLASGLWTVTFIRSPNALKTSYLHYLHRALHGAMPDVQGLFSRFGWLDVDTAAHLWLLGYVASLLLIGSAFVRMAPAARWKFITIAVAAGLITLAVTITEIAGGFLFQARYTLAILAPLALLAVTARATRSGGPRLPRVCIALMIVLNAAALYGNAQRYAVGNRGSIFFVTDAKWVPPGGWWPTVVIGLVGLVTLFLAGVVDPTYTDRTESICLEIAG